ncbi:MAG: hypothetical protein WC523_06665 [Patescibacteria group bacterium]
MKYTTKNVLLSIAGVNEKLLLSKIKEINKLKITRVALFLTMIKKDAKRRVFKALLKSTIKEIPLVHLRNDMSQEEIIFLENNFHPTYYTIHENSFDHLHKWPKFKKRLYLEFGGHGKRKPQARVEAIGGFCVDLAHYKIAETSQTVQFRYQFSKRKQKKLFACNHLNGYSPKTNTCIHEVGKIEEFDFLKTLPKFIFGKTIALEMENPIREQLIWRKKLIKMLNQRV